MRLGSAALCSLFLELSAWLCSSSRLPIYHGAGLQSEKWCVVFCTKHCKAFRRRCLGTVRRGGHGQRRVLVYSVTFS